MKSTLELLKNATNTYNGNTGCACGCGGSYADVNSTTGKKRIKRILNADPNKVTFINFSDYSEDEGCFDLENAEGTRVLRVYVGKEAN